MAKTISLYVPAALFVGVVIFISLFPEPVAALKLMLVDNSLKSYVVFVALLVIATVCMPITVLPLIPMSAAMFGPFPTAVLSIVGWTLGAVLAFLIARYAGRPILERFFSMREIDVYVESVPQKHRFLLIVILRMTVPVDILSYALGLTKTVGIFEYTVATMIGVLWFSFAFSYLGEALLTGNVPLFIGLGSLSLLIFIAGWYFMKELKIKN